jgi:hypothetical protein
MFFGCQGRSNVRRSPGTGYGDLAKTPRFCPFRPVLYAITHCFWVSVGSKRSGNPGVRLRGARQNSRETRKAITCADSTKPATLPAGYSLPDMDLPEIGRLPGVCVPQMGMHSLPTPTLTDTVVFSGTMVMGFYQGRPIFFEPMIARAKLLERRSFSLPMVTPAGLAAGVHLRGPCQNSHIWSILTSFLCYYSLFFGCRGRPKVRGSPGSGYGELAKTRRFGPLFQVFYAITH